MVTVYILKVSQQNFNTAEYLRGDEMLQQSVTLNGMPLALHRSLGVLGAAGCSKMLRCKENTVLGIADNLNSVKQTTVIFSKILTGSV